MISSDYLHAVFKHNFPKGVNMGWASANFILEELIHQIEAISHHHTIGYGARVELVVAIILELEEGDADCLGEVERQYKDLQWVVDAFEKTGYHEEDPDDNWEDDEEGSICD